MRGCSRQRTARAKAWRQEKAWFVGDQRKVFFWASWLVFAGVHTSFVSRVTVLRGCSECLVWILHHVESWGESRQGRTGAEHGGSPESGGGWEH